MFTCMFILSLSSNTMLKSPNIITGSVGCTICMSNGNLKLISKTVLLVKVEKCWIKGGFSWMDELLFQGLRPTVKTIILP